MTVRIPAWAEPGGNHAGGQLSLLFEDLFKKMNSDLLMEARKTLAKASRTTAFDAVQHVRSDIITHAMEAALSTGCWNIKRFKMDRKGATQVPPPTIMPQAPHHHSSPLRAAPPASPGHVWALCPAVPHSCNTQPFPPCKPVQRWPEQGHGVVFRSGCPRCAPVLRKFWGHKRSPLASTLALMQAAAC